MNTETAKSNPPPRCCSKLFRAVTYNPAPRCVVTFVSRRFYGIVVVVVREYGGRDDLCVFEK